MKKNIGNEMKEFWLVEEEWRDIPGYERLYQVSNFGNVRSRFSGGRWKVLKQSKRDGFLYVTLSDNGMSKTFPVHRLVGEAFIPKENETKKVITHINGDRINNCVLNLEWVAWKEGYPRYIKIKELKEEFTGYATRDSQ
ncbi:NUMOD4 domain-containing protein [Bacillus salipaludis]|uniref:NUMOD4 domain-containing protein n=1 Tax=Bacillus salipaludis TaxID=2547811 RepID=UPI003D1F838C